MLLNRLLRFGATSARVGAASLVNNSNSKLSSAAPASSLLRTTAAVESQRLRLFSLPSSSSSSSSTTTFSRIFSSTAAPASSSKAKAPAATAPPSSQNEQKLASGSVVVHHPMPGFFDPVHPSKRISNEKLFVVLNINGRQFKAGEDDVIMTDLIKGCDIGETLSFDEVLLVGCRNFTVIGKPHVTEARVIGTIEQHTHTRPLTVFKMRRRTTYKRVMRYRHSVTMLRINSIELKM